MGDTQKKWTIPGGLPVCLAFTGFLLNLIAYYPGFMSPDSLDIYGQSLSHHYTDWHPPLMAWFWSLLNNIYRGPQGMLIFQLGLLWTGFYFLSTGWFSSRRSYLYLFTGLLIAPFVQNFAGYIIKDAQMALSWFLSFSIIAKADYRNRRMTVAEAVISFLLILYGTLIRINALPGALPLVYYWSANYLPWSNRRAAMAVVLAIFMLLVVGCQSFLTSLLTPQKKYAEYKLYLHDLAGIYVKTGKSYWPSFISQSPGFDSVYLKSHYTPATLDNLFWNEENKISFPPLNDSLSPIVRQAWMKSITENPGVYLLNRWDGFLYYLRIKKRTWIVTLHAEISPNDYGLHFEGNFISAIFLKIIKLQKGLPYMRPWFWLIVNLITLVTGFYIHSKAIKKIVWILSLSSLLYLVPQFFIFQVDTDFRYFYWNCVSLFVCIYFLWENRRSKAPVILREKI